jgi:DNA repair exonuclease SbcCD nuclease subunit
MHKAIIEAKSKRNPPPFVKEHNEEHYVYSDNPKFNGMDVVISGHWHKRDIFKQGNTLFINPGTLTRRRANEDEINTFPSVVILKKTSLGFYDYDLISLKCAKPSEEVISEDHLEETRDKSTLVSGLEDFIFSLKEMNIDYKTKFIVDLLEIITQPGIERKVEQVIRTTLIDVFGKDYEYEIENNARRSTTNLKILKPKEGEFTRKISRKKLLLKKIER